MDGRVFKMSRIERMANDEVLERMNKDRELINAIKRINSAYRDIIVSTECKLLPLIGLIEGKIERERGIDPKIS